MKKALSFLLSLLVVLGSMTCLFTVPATANEADITPATTETVVEALPENLISSSHFTEEATHIKTVTEATDLNVPFDVDKDNVAEDHLLGTQARYNLKFGDPDNPDGAGRSYIHKNAYYQLDIDVTVSADTAEDVTVYPSFYSNPTQYKVGYMYGVRYLKETPGALENAYTLNESNNSSLPSADKAATVKPGTTYRYTYIICHTDNTYANALHMIVDGLDAGEAGSVTFSNPNLFRVSDTVWDDFTANSTNGKGTFHYLAEENGNVFLRIYNPTTANAAIRSTVDGGYYNILFEEGTVYKLNYDVRVPSGGPAVNDQYVFTVDFYETSKNAVLDSTEQYNEIRAKIDLVTGTTGDYSSDTTDKVPFKTVVKDTYSEWENGYANCWNNSSVSRPAHRVNGNNVSKLAYYNAEGELLQTVTSPYSYIGRGKTHTLDYSDWLSGEYSIEAFGQTVEETVKALYDYKNLSGGSNYYNTLRYTLGSDGKTWTYNNSTSARNAAAASLDDAYVALAFSYIKPGYVYDVDNIKLISTESVDIEFQSTDGEVFAGGDNEDVSTTLIGNGDGTKTASIKMDVDPEFYSFKGWFSKDTCVSTEKEFTFKEGDYSKDDLKAVITSLNVLTNGGSFESYNSSASVRVEKESGAEKAAYPTGMQWGYYANWSSQTVNGSVVSGAYGVETGFNIYSVEGTAESKYLADTEAFYYSVNSGDGNTAFKNQTAVTVSPRTGNNMIQTNVHSRTAVKTLEGLKPNTDYALTMYVWDPDKWNFLKTAAISDSCELPTNTSASGTDKLGNDYTIYGAAQTDSIADEATTMYTWNKTNGEYTASNPTKIVDETYVRDWRKVTVHFTTSNEAEKTYYLLLSYQSVSSQGSISQYYLDDLTCVEVFKTDIDLDMKSCASVEPIDCDINNVIVGQEFKFRVVHNQNTDPTVKLNSAVLTPDADGVYTCELEDKNNLSVRFNGDETLNDYDKDYEGNDLSEYNSDVYLKNIWEGDTVYQESALFISGKDTVKLLYPVDKVVSLRSYSLDVNYVEGVDYEVTEEGLIKITEDSRIPVYSAALTTDTKPDRNAFPLRDDSTKWLVSIGDTTYAKYAISITYEHSKTFEDGYQPEAPVVQNKALNGVLEKLENGESVNIVIYGDSISCGWSSSGINPSIEIYDENSTEGKFVSYNLNVAPYAPTFAQMIEAQLKALYPDADINIKNLSLGGKSSPWAATNVTKRLALWKDEDGNQVVPDLIMVGFGVNDSAGNVTAENFKANMKAIVDSARTATGNADMEALYYSPMLPNQLTDTWDVKGMLAYEDALVELAEADENIGVLKLTSIFAEIIKSKAPEDYLSSYWNHGNDFTARMYATGILAAILGDAPTADAPTAESVTHKSVTLTAKAGYEYSIDGKTWQTSNVFTDLNTETEYTFYQRFAETNNTYAGDMSEATMITTAALPPFTPGNVNGDEKNDVNLDDVVALAQVVAGWQDVVHDEAALDINGDGSVDLDDVVTLAQYVAGWDGIELSDIPYSPEK